MQPQCLKYHNNEYKKQYTATVPKHTVQNNCKYQQVIKCGRNAIKRYEAETSRSL